MAGQEHLDILLEAYGIFSHTNPLHTDVWPSMRQLESDVIAMTASMLGGLYLSKASSVVWKIVHRQLLACLELSM